MKKLMNRCKIGYFLAVSILIFSIYNCNHTTNDSSKLKKEAEILKDTTVQKNIPKNIIIKKDHCFYIPNNNRGKKLGTIVLFDPHANGENVIKKYTNIADDLDIILVASMVSKNGMDINFIKLHVQNMLDKIINTLPVDENNIVVAGFSGGGRVATEVSREDNRIIGVISCGSANEPVKRKNCSNLIICGNEDFNYLESVNVYFNNSKKNIDLIDFNGKHEWPSQEIFKTAVMSIFNKDIKIPEFNISNEERMYLNTEEKLRGELVMSFASQDLTWWSNKINDYRKKSKSQHKLEAQLSKRLLAYLGMISFAYTKKAIEDERMDYAVRFIKIYEYLEPDNKDMIKFRKQIEASI